MIKIGGTSVAFVIIIFSTALAFIFLLNIVDGSPIVADGLENLTIAKNIASHFSFSSGSPENPDMVREPVWPGLAALIIYLAQLKQIPVEMLASTYSVIFKSINVFIYAISIGIASLFFFSVCRNVFFSVLLFLLAFSLYGNMPRLINNFNNEALATLLILVNSILFYEIVKGRLTNSTYLAPIFLGILLGVLALTKAQFLYICVPIFFVLFIDNKKKAFISLIVLFAVSAPWLYRNYILFGEPAIAERGKTVAAVRLVLTSEPTTQEHLCMAYAFSHPRLQSSLEPFLGVNKLDFSQGNKCQKLNREICFDMGPTKVTCAPFPEDASSSDWSSKIQYFYRGYSAGQLIEQNKLGFKDIAELNVEFVKNYMKTLPLFAWRGFGFSDYPLLSVVVSFSLFGMLFSRLRTFALLAVSSHLFHIMLTHNIPRYHTVEIPVMIFSAVYFIDQFRKSFKKCTHA